MQKFLDAVENNEISIVQNLIKNGVDINVRDKGGSTALMRASLHCYIDLIDLLLRSGAEVNLHDKTGKTALHYAVQEGCEGAVKKLLNGKAEINSQDLHGNSPLSDAVFSSRGRGDLIALLRQHGADDNQPNKHGVTPLHLAKTIANYDIIQFFKS